MQLSLHLDDQEEEPPQGSASPFTLSVPQTDGKPRLTALPDAPAKNRGIRMTPQCRAFRTRFFPHATDAQWSDWRWQLQHRIRDLASVRQMIRLTTEEETALVLGGEKLPMAVTPHYMGLIAPDDPDQAIRRTMIPTVYELRRCPGEADDPLGEEHQSPIPGLVHRYPDRVLLLATDFCSAYCRYCTRSRMVGHGAITPGIRRLRMIFDYIRSHPQVRDVLISGGDPLTLSDDRLEFILSNLRAIPHVEIIRIGTKVPAVLPQRVTPQLTRMLRRYHPLWMSLHFTHPDECCHETARACGLLADAGIPLGSQTVLLRGMNDTPDVMRRLMHGLMKMRVKPYYLYQCDPITGSEHFRTPVARGVELIRSLRGHTSGYAVPTYVIDAPGGGGKIPVAPDYVAGRDADGALRLTNYEGGAYSYPDVAGEF
ncbi:MAG: KamA family radical SAM protein [Verrucomicrobiota bacterium]|nr:KamA family radical SAM protein [Verrucomicrobiota bacterium]